MNFDKIFDLTAGVHFHFYNDIMFNIMPTLYAGFLVSVPRMVIENRHFDLLTLTTSRGFTRPISFMRAHCRTRANDLP